MAAAFFFEAFDFLLTVFLFGIGHGGDVSPYWQTSVDWSGAMATAMLSLWTSKRGSCTVLPMGIWNLSWFTAAQPAPLGGYTFMKNRTLFIVLALGFVIGGSHTAFAQMLSSSAPIIVRFSEIDRYGVSVMPEKRAHDGARLGLPYHDMKPTAVDALVREGTLLNRPVWIMDGARVVARCRLLGLYVWSKSNEYGLLLSFDSIEEAQKIGALVKLEPSIEDLLRQGKSKASDPRFWIF